MHISDLHYCHCIQGCFYEYENLVVTGNTYLGQLDLPNATKDCCFWIENVAVYRHLENRHAGCSELFCCGNDWTQSKLIVIAILYIYIYNDFNCIQIDSSYSGYFLN